MDQTELGIEEVVVEDPLLSGSADELGTFGAGHKSEGRASFLSAKDADESLGDALIADQALGPLVLAKLAGAILVGAAGLPSPALGLLDQAVSVSNAFLNRGEIVSIRGREPEDMQRFQAKPDPGDLTKGKPLIILINGGSASASEIVAGALQDHKRGTLIGTRSFGKGSVQTIIPLGPVDGALRLTTARYFTPSGRSIQALGITPEIELPQDVPDDLKGEELGGEASLRGHLKASGEEEKGSQSYIPPNPKDDKVLNLALDLMRGTQVNAAFPPNLQQAGAH